MKKLIIILFSPFLIYGQQKSFMIKGFSSFYNNKNIIVETVLSASQDSAYIADCSIVKYSNLPVNELQVNNNEFTVTGNIEYPVPFVISFYNEEKNTGYDSEIFFVEKGEINIKVKFKFLLFSC